MIKAILFDLGRVLNMSSTGHWFIILTNTHFIKMLKK